MFEHFLPLWEPVEELPSGELLTLDTSAPLAKAPGRSALRLGSP